MQQDRSEQIIAGVRNILLSRLAPVKIWLFGSRAKGKASLRADFDFAVEGVKPEVAQRRELRTELDKVSGLYKVDVIYWEEVDPEFRKIIQETGKVIYEQGKDLRH